MSKFLYVFICLGTLIVLPAHSAVSFGCEKTFICASGNCIFYNSDACRDNTTFYYGDYGFVSCKTCDAGYILKLKSAAVQVGSNVCNVSYNSCELDCVGCTDCVSDTSWSSNGTGYEKKVTRTCSCNTCNTSTQYRCAAGYYGTSTNGTSGCAKCSNGGTSVAGATSQTLCYIAGGGVVSDGTGTYTYTNDCYWAN